MFRWILPVILALGATPSQALVRFDSAFATFSTVQDFEDLFPGLGFTGRSFGFSDIGGCESFDANGGGRCGGYENTNWSLSLTNSSFSYRAMLRQDHAVAFSAPDSWISVSAVFRADRELRLRPQELRSLAVPLCQGSCTNGFGSSVRQEQQSDGSWLAFIDVGTSAATREGIQQLDHRLTLTLTEVPEPVTWELLIAGFGLIGAAQRSRRNATSPPPARRNVC